MTKKRSIDRKRDAALTVIVGTVDDTSPITVMVEVRGSVHVVKGGGIYQIIMADDTDPGRTNINVPDAQQRVIAYGSDTDFVCKIFLTANGLLRSYLPKHIDAEAGLAYAFDILKEVASMQDVVRGIQASQDDAMSRLQANQLHNVSFSLPTVGDLDASAKTFLQKAAHALSFMLRLARVFFPDCSEKRFFEPLRHAAVQKFGPEDALPQLLTDLMGFTQDVRDARNCVEHPKATERVIVRDFSLKPDLSISPPSIEIIHPNSPQPKMPILGYMANIQENITDFTELLLALLCSRHMKETGIFPIQVLEIPTDIRQIKYLRYGYGIYTEDDRVILAS